VIIGDQSRLTCAIGKEDVSISRVGLSEFLQDPQRYYGLRVRIRGYFVLETERTVLLEPTERQDYLMLNISRLHVGTADEIFACRSKLVDVDGYLTHVPHRGTERPVIFADGMFGAQVQRE
jgi:hypothetical protein